MDRNENAGETSEDALRESEELFRALTETIVAAIFVYREKFLYVNPEALSMTGYSREELLNMPFWELVHPDFREMVKRRGFKRLSGEDEPRHYVMKIVRKDGRDLWVNISTTAFKYKGKLAGLAVLIDITDRMRVEEALQDSEERFRAMMEQSPFSIQIISPDGRTVEVNGAFEKLWGVGLEDLKDYNILKDEQLRHLGLIQYIEKGFSGGTASIPPALYDVRIGLGKGEKRWVTARIYPIKDASGNVRNVILIHEDITDRMEAQLALAEAKARADMYLDIMGHDITNINQIGIGYLELARDLPDLSAEEKEILTKPLEAFKDSSRLIDNVKKIQRVMAGEMALWKIDLGKVLLETVSQHREIPDRDITIHYTPVIGCIVLANDLLKDVFTHIIGNSLAHSTGSIVISICLTRLTEGDTAYYKVAVDDNGPGIPDTLKPVLFTRFEKGKTLRGGRGLGLSLVRALIDSYHGRVWAENRVAGDYTKGSRFVVLLPVATEDQCRSVKEQPESKHFCPSVSNL